MKRGSRDLRSKKIRERPSEENALPGRKK